MSKRHRWFLGGMAVLVVVLSAGFGQVGSDLDSFRLRTSDQQFEIEDLEHQVVELIKERNALQDRVAGQNEVITQLTHELYRANARARYAEEQERRMRENREKQTGATE